MLAYQMQQNCRLNSEYSRSANQAPMSAAMLGGAMPMMQAMEGGCMHDAFFADQPQMTQAIADVPLADKCIAQIVLDWEFIHDLDLHLLKVVSAHPSSHNPSGLAQEPQPEPETRGPGIADDLSTLVNPATNELRLKSNHKLEQVVWYGSKVFNPRGSATPQAVLQLDRNAAVHSIKPVENLYLTNELDAGIYVVGVHNYSQHQLKDDLIGSSANHRYRSFEEFKKKDPGYQMMEKALNDQLSHADDPDGTPEKLAIMTRVDEEMARGSQMMQDNCCSGSGRYGVHYGTMIYTYPQHVSKHPQASTVEELQANFAAEFFATSDCIFNPEENASGYNGANVVADVQTPEGKLALTHCQAAHVGLMKVERDSGSGTARVVEVKILRGMPRSGELGACDIEGGSVAPRGMSAMNQFRALMSTGRCGSQASAQQSPGQEPQMQAPPRAQWQQFGQQAWQPQVQMQA